MYIHIIVAIRRLQLNRELYNAASEQRLALDGYHIRYALSLFI